MTTYQDSDGRECDLPTMCRREPEWAASRLGASIAEIAKLTAALREVLEIVEETSAMDGVYSVNMSLGKIIDICNAAGIGETGGE